MEISSISFAIRRSESFDGRESPRLPRFSAFRLSKNRHWDHGLRARLIRESKLSCIIHGRAFAPPSPPLLPLLPSPTLRHAASFESETFGIPFPTGNLSRLRHLRRRENSAFYTSILPPPPTRTAATFHDRSILLHLLFLSLFFSFF